MTHKITNTANVFLFVLGFIILINAKPAFGQKTVSPNDGRYVRTIDAQWKFIRQDIENGSDIGLDDRSWETVNLPHSWNSRDAFSDVRGYYRGAAWYRKNLFISNQDSGKQIFIKFGAANQLADVYVNGHHVLVHKGGYTAFAANITKWVRFGEDNIIAVRVDNSFNADIPPLTADFTFFGGIYRNVWLIMTNPVHIAVDDYASAGVFIHASDASDKNATVNISANLVNNSAENQTITLQNIVTNAEGKSITQNSEEISLPPHQKKTISVVLPKIQNPHLWSPADPYLYSVKTVLKAGNNIIDEEYNPLGIRWYRFDPDQGFFLNGHHLALRGVSRHQFYPGLGNALPQQLQIQDMEIIKKMGANFVRLAHYPQDQSVLRAADKLGILIWQESPDVNFIHVSENYTENASEALREMIHQYYNHPSIILWGFMNEILLRHGIGRRFNHMSEEEYDQHVVDLAKKLNQIAHKLDPTRETTIALDRNLLYDKIGLSDVTDVVGWNLYNGWYYPMYDEKGTNLFGQFLDEQHKNHPKRVLIVSEYGAGSDTRIHTLYPKPFDFSVEYQNQYHETILDQLQERPFIAGSAAWIMYDFPSETRNDTRPWINEKGLVDRHRKPKEVFYLYKAWLSDKPIVHIASHDWTRRTVPYSLHDQKTFEEKITIFSNLSDLKLYLNGHSLGMMHPKNHIAIWSVPMRIGENQLLAEGKTDGKVISDVVTIHLSFSGDFESDSHQVNQLFVNAGAHVQFYPKSGAIWEADQPYQGHQWGYVGGKEGLNSDNILGTSDDPIYQDYRSGMKQYHFDVPQGSYMVTVYLAEPEFGINGKRIFSVAANKIPVFTNVDLAKTYGKDVPVKHSVILNVDDTNGINITFDAKVGEAIVNGIEIKRL
ncbi:MAG: hypothetical protein IH595_09065 [Bacteroidales bacterium]|nr:hypothetical protein [Bacteroidales bacterium]